jgi:hypothetical protein
MNKENLIFLPNSLLENTRIMLQVEEAILLNFRPFLAPLRRK